MDNIHRLYATTGRRRNPALVLAKERIVAKIAKRQKELADLRAAEKVVKRRGGFASLVGGMGLITNKDNEAARRSRLTKANPKTKMSKGEKNKMSQKIITVSSELQSDEPSISYND